MCNVIAGRDKQDNPKKTEKFRQQIQEEIILELRGLKAAQHFHNRLFSNATADIFVTDDSLFININQSFFVTFSAHLPVRITRRRLPCKSLGIRSINMDAYGGHISIKFTQTSFQNAPDQIQIWDVKPEHKYQIKKSLGGIEKLDELFAY